MNTKRSGLFARLVLGLALIAQLIYTAAFPTSVRAASTITVNTMDDNTASDTFCSLREALTNANDDAATYGDCIAGSGDDTIIFAGNYTITLTGQLPAITSVGITTGSGAANTILQANTSPNTATYRVLEVNGVGNLTLNNLTLQNGRCNGVCATQGSYGGGILNSGTLTLNNITVSNNSASHGGGIFNNLNSTAILTI